MTGDLSDLILGFALAPRSGAPTPADVALLVALARAGASRCSERWDR